MLVWNHCAKCIFHVTWTPNQTTGDCTKTKHLGNNGQQSALGMSDEVSLSGQNKEQEILCLGAIQWEINHPVNSHTVLSFADAFTSVNLIQNSHINSLIKKEKIVWSKQIWQVSIILNTLYKTSVRYKQLSLVCFSERPLCNCLQDLFSARQFYFLNAVNNDRCWTKDTGSQQNFLLYCTTGLFLLA